MARTSMSYTGKSKIPTQEKNSLKLLTVNYLTSLKSVTELEVNSKIYNVTEVRHNSPKSLTVNY